MDKETTANKKKAKKTKIASNTVDMLSAGDLLMARCPGREYAASFRKYESLLENFANMDREERLINYKFFIGLVLTSHAKKTANKEDRRKLFDLKNALYFNLANNKLYRKKMNFRYLTSKNFRVTSYCPECDELNQKENHPRHRWKFCEKCKIDKNFYNILALYHKFDQGSVTLFLSNDLIHKVENIRLTKRGKLEEAEEETRFQKYRYNVRELSIFKLDCIIKIQKKLLET